MSPTRYNIAALLAKFPGRTRESLMAMKRWTNETDLSVDVDSLEWRRWTGNVTVEPNGIGGDGEWGPRLWGKLHALALNSSEPPDAAEELEWLSAWRMRVPCGVCKPHWDRLVEKTPPDFTSRESYFAWGVDRHNEVNASLGKPMFTVEQARQRWGSEDRPARTFSPLIAPPAVATDNLPGDDTPGVPFANTRICRGQQHCELCRRADAGRAWRREQKETHPTPDDRVDFKCPYGKPWGFRHPRSGALPLGVFREPIVIQHNQGLGDAVMLTAAIRDLDATHRSKYRIAVRTERPELFENNPHVEPDDGTGETHVIECFTNEYRDDDPHFLFSFTRKLSAAMGVKINPGKLGGDIHLSRDEIERPPPIDGPYWVMFAGGKNDFTTKWWSGYQAVADGLRGKVRFVQAGAGGDFHQPLEGVENVVGKTGLRDLIRLVYHADGVVSPISAGMHLAAAVPVPRGRPQLRPCVVIAGGRETANFVQYPGHTVLHTIGWLSCCADGACWKYKVGIDCPRPVDVGGGLRIAECMTMIRPERVIEAIEGYERVAAEYRGAAVPSRELVHA